MKQNKLFYLFLSTTNIFIDYLKYKVIQNSLLAVHVQLSVDFLNY